MRKPNENTLKAVALVQSGMSEYAAAKAVGVLQSTLNGYMRRRKAEVAAAVQPCPCCGAPAAFDALDISTLTRAARAKVKRPE